MPLRLKIPPLLLMAVTALAMRAFGLTVTWLALPIEHSILLGVIVASTGAVVALAGIVAFRVHRTTTNPLRPGAASSLVRTGIYRVSRNPMYLGFLVILVGWGVALANAGALALVPAFGCYLTRCQIRPEEEAVLENFGDAAHDYFAAVPRWL